MQSLIQANRHAERQRHHQLMSKVANDFQRASQERMPLTQRYLLSVENMKLQLYAMQISFGAHRSMKNLFQKGKNLRVSAQEFTPALLSESSSDIESSDSESETSGRVHCSPECGFDFDYPENNKLLDTRRAELIGKSVVGRLNIFEPQSGATRYYLNWSSNKSDNVRISPEVIQESFVPEELRSGMHLQCTITSLGPDYIRWDKQHPQTNRVRHAPRRNRKQRNNRR